MSLHINRFLDRVRAAESRQQRDVILTVTEAKDLHSDITRLLLLVENLRTNLDSQKANDAEVLQVELRGGDF